MDYRKLIADGEYKKEDLNDVNRAFVEGIEYVVREIDCFYSPEETEDDFSNTLTNIKQEIIEKVVEEIKEYIEVVAAETTVEMLDGQEEEKLVKWVFKDGKGFMCWACEPAEITPPGMGQTVTFVDGLSRSLVIGMSDLIKDELKCAKNKCEYYNKFNSCSGYCKDFRTKPEKEEK